MARVITLAHLSDVHLAPITGFSLPYWNVKRGLGWVNWQRGRRAVHLRAIADAMAADVRAQAPDHIAVSGDLANLGLPGEYRAALDWLTTVASPDRLSVVPGNHDIYSARLYGASCLAEWAAYMTSDAPGAALLPPRPAGTHEDLAKSTFPFVRRIGPVALIGINSAVPTPPFVAAGRLGAGQLSALEAILQRLSGEPVARVIMIHHPPLAHQAPKLRALDDSPALAAVLERSGAELVIHGHNHTDTLEWLPANMGAVPISGVPSASAALKHGKDALGGYALYEIEVDETGLGRAPIDGVAAGAASVRNRCRITRVVRGLAHEGGLIVELSRRFLTAPVASAAAR